METPSSIDRDVKQSDSEHEPGVLIRLEDLEASTFCACRTSEDNPY